MDADTVTVLPDYLQGFADAVSARMRNRIAFVDFVCVHKESRLRSVCYFIFSFHIMLVDCNNSGEIVRSEL